MNNEIDTINVGIFGHIDHGKTTLLQKLSGKWTDTHSEELKRGITIKLGYADITIYKDKEEYNIQGKGTPVRQVSFIDSPGHEMLMATTLSGAALIDAAILVVAANEGIKPQTREHLMALKAKKVENLIVVQNKIDLVNIEQAKKSHKEIREFLGEEFKKAPIIPVSAQQEVNINEILKEIVLTPIPKREINKEPIFIIARSFDINRPGTLAKDLHGAVLGGSLKRGTLKIGQEIEIKPGLVKKENNEIRYISIKTKISSLYKGSKKVPELTPGGSMSIETELDMTLGKNDALGGNVAAPIGALPELKKEIKLKYTLFPKVYGASTEAKVEEIKKGETLMLSINTSITGGIVNNSNKNDLGISLRIPSIFFKSDNVGIARNIQGHWRLIGYGEII